MYASKVHTHVNVSLRVWVCVRGEQLRGTEEGKQNTSTSQSALHCHCAFSLSPSRRQETSLHVITRSSTSLLAYTHTYTHIYVHAQMCV